MHLFNKHAAQFVDLESAGIHYGVSWSGITNISADRHHGHSIIGLDKVDVNAYFAGGTSPSKLLKTVSYIDHIDMAVFISYSSRDKVLAGQIKIRLREFDIKTFLAHDDIPGGSEWVDSIRENIRDCHLFLALVTNTYHVQEHTDQELGMAVYAKKPVVCIVVNDAQPRGFAQSCQHIHYSPNRGMMRLGIAVMNAVLQVVAPAKKLDFVIERLAISSHYDDSNALARHIPEDVHLSRSQVAQLTDAFVANNQVRHARHFAGKHVLSILIRHFDNLDYDVIDKIKGMVSKISWYEKQLTELQVWEDALAAEDIWADEQMDLMRSGRR